MIAACTSDVSKCWPRPVRSRTYSPELMPVTASSVAPMLAHGMARKIGPSRHPVWTAPSGTSKPGSVRSVPRMWSARVPYQPPWSHCRPARAVTNHSMPGRWASGVSRP